jgi:AbiV family abortive infection protein
MLKKIYDAIFITYENIIDLHECADLLYNQGKTNRSYTLYHFSFEEGGRFFYYLKLYLII